MASSQPPPGAPAAPRSLMEDVAAAAAGGSSAFPDAVACSFDPPGEKLAVMYSDRSLVLWDVRSPSKVRRAGFIQGKRFNFLDPSLSREGEVPCQRIIGPRGHVLLYCLG